MRSTIVASLTALVLAVVLARPGLAQTYPNGQVRLIVPTSPGGVTDTMARIVAQRLAEQIGQTVIVDNRPGGNSAVGAQAVARSPADGLTLMVTSDATITANPYLSSRLPYSPKDFTPIMVLCRGTPVLVINSAVPASNTRELVALAKSKPGTLNYGSYGVGTSAWRTSSSAPAPTSCISRTAARHRPQPHCSRATSLCCCSISRASRRTRRPAR
jgi:tripartite-type tricarboxylate transporter receptor subunit TctC